MKKVVAIGGSLRKASCNYGLLRAARTLGVDHGIDVDVVEQDVLRSLPLYDGDLDPSGSTVGAVPAWPAQVAALRERVRAADGVLLACPEYNYMPSPILANTIAWLSRGNDVDQQPFRGKPVAIVGSGGGMGTSRAQYVLRTSLVFLRAHAMPDEYFGNSFAGAFESHSGNLVGAAETAKLKEHLQAFRAYMDRAGRN